MSENATNASGVRGGSVSTPERIGRFRILSMLGRGAMGIVYLGHDEEIDRLVAIKLIRADLLDTDERDGYLKRFRNEAKIAGRCIHANIVGLYDYAMHDGNPYLVMEYVDGVGLQQVFPRGTRRSVEEVIGIALQVLDALHYAHGRGIVHRDIKPANILMMAEGRLKITDFGISRLTSMEMTATPLLIGTPSYMSPEQCIGAALDGRNDLFSLGCVLYELVAGERPFTGLNYTETLFSIVNRPHAPLGGLRDDLPHGFSEALDRALAKTPDDRFPDAGAFARALDAIARPFADPTRRPPSPSPHPLVEAALAPPPPAPAPPAVPEPREPVAETMVMPIPGGARLSDGEPIGGVATGPADEDATVVQPAEIGIPPHEASTPVPDPDPVPTPEVPTPPLSPLRTTVEPPPPADGGRPVGPAERAHLSRCLAEVIGPIAPLLLRRAERDGMSSGALILRLADSVRRPDERARFLSLATRGSNR